KPGTFALAMSRGGFGLRFSLDPHRELSTRSGRKFAKLADGDDIVGVIPSRKKDILAVVTRDSRTLLCEADDVAELAGPGRGVTVIKLEDDDQVIGFGLGKADADTIVRAETDSGKTHKVGPGHDEVVSRGSKGRAIGKRTKIARVLPADDSQVN
ncbi:MAG: DNA gyrase C-terminal beta-propeller domain-containing protein, partial [Deltaproteobacteria bacterium]|nr:DNA gyrase C-terminal beta-propeller domain-containing protein [Deltaproteobacteria bacterium]